MALQSVSKTVYKSSGKHMDATGLKVYNLGGGSKKYPGVVNVDINGNLGADIVQDLNQTPWDIPSDSADLVLMFQTLEHLTDLPKVFSEIHRISKDGARVVIDVPYFRSKGAFQDPTHVHFFTARTLDYVSCCRPLSEYDYLKERFDYVDFWYGWPNSGNSLSGFLKGFFKNNASFYDQYLSLLLPVDIIVYELEVNKSGKCREGEVSSVASNVLATIK